MDRNSWIAVHRTRSSVWPRCHGWRGEQVLHRRGDEETFILEWNDDRDANLSNVLLHSAAPNRPFMAFRRSRWPVPNVKVLAAAVAAVVL
jgi:hypothetical protein